MHRYLATTTCALLLGAGAQAAVMTQSGSVPLQTTNWSTSISVDQFDEMGGLRTLQSVTWSVTGIVEGSAGAESIGSAPRTVTLNLMAEMGLSRSGSMLATVTPQATESFEAGAFDGLLDFDGSSGAYYEDLNAQEGVSGVADDLAPYIGQGQITLDAFATAMSSASGGGNLATEFNTMASMEYVVTYEFLEVPGPGAAALLGVAGLASGRRRRS